MLIPARGLASLADMTAGSRLPNLTDQEFRGFQEMLWRLTGISLANSKRALVRSRLVKRLVYWQLSSYGEYLRVLTSGRHPQELQLAIDLLTTNETYFFREPKHFDFVRQRILPQLKPGKPLRVWSAACSSGEEPYSLAMLFSDVLGQASGRWEILASDISETMLQRVRKGHYVLDRTQHIPNTYLQRFCLKGVKSQEGTFLVRPELRANLTIRQINLNQALPSIGEFDLIFLRNVLIYFNPQTKKEVVRRLEGVLRPGGHLIVGHAESLNGMTEDLETVMPSIYRKPLTASGRRL